MKEKEDFGSIGVSFRQGKDIKVTVADIKVLKAEGCLSAGSFFAESK